VTVKISDPRPASAGASRTSGRPISQVVLEVVKFSLVGGSGIAVNFLVFNLLLHGVKWEAMEATVMASVVAMTTNYVGFRYFTYRDRAARTRRQVVWFFAFSAIGVIMESGLFYVGYDGLGMRSVLEANAAKALSIILASAFRFVVYRTFVFQHETPGRE
jgi:putative flippase GtrA